MKDYTISEQYRLPSNGEIYNISVDPEINLRSMTTEEEMKRLSRSNNIYRNICEIIDDCIINDIGISSYDMCLADFQFLVYKLRTVTYGKDYQIESACPFCGCKNSLTVNLDSLDTSNNIEELEKYSSLQLPTTGDTLSLTFQTPRILDQNQSELKSFMDKIKNKDLDLSIVFTIKNAITLINGRSPDPITIMDWIRKLPMKDTNYILNYLDKLNNCVFIDTKIEHECDICGLTSFVQLKSNAEFFRPHLDI